MKNLNFSPAFINTSTGPQQVTFSFDVADDLAGIHEIRVDEGGGGYAYYMIGYAYLQSPSGGQQVFAGFWLDSQRQSGTPLRGIWQATAHFPQYSEAGTWEINYLILMDGVRNSRYLNMNDLEALGMPTEIVIIQPSLTSDGTLGPGGGTVQDSTFGARAEITAPPGVLSTSTDVSIDVLSTPPNIPIPQGFGSGGSSYVNIELTPKPTGPLPAPGLTLTIPLSTTMTPGTKLNLFRINSGSGTLVPAFDSNGAPIVGTVDASGNSATFNGIISFCTVVALKLTATVLGDLNGDGFVTCADLAIVKASFGKKKGQSGFDPRADVNNDGVVNIIDLAFISKLLPAGTQCK